MLCHVLDAALGAGIDPCVAVLAPRTAVLLRAAPSASRGSLWSLLCYKDAWPHALLLCAVWLSYGRESRALLSVVCSLSLSKTEWV